ncbi:hypothetical protein CE91St19_06660 [Odoribacter laneus]|nr:hypothetical protein CE91St19_06660 [Odoribacter laneus]GKI25846.1 hypothetical protein CE91St20_19830 [Odoribacter laneus]
MGQNFCPNCALTGKAKRSKNTIMTNICPIKNDLKKINIGIIIAVKFCKQFATECKIYSKMRAKNIKSDKKYFYAITNPLYKSIFILLFDE